MKNYIWNYAMKCRRLFTFLELVILVLFLASCGEPELEISTMAGSKEDGTSEESVEDIDIETEDVVASSTRASNDVLEEEAIVVYVCGAVVTEGVYTLPTGSRVSDALEMAGGYSDDAFRGYINLASVLTDGERIYFPTINEVEDTSNPLTKELYYGNGVPDGSSESGGEELVNINTAGAEELKSLPGIGDSKARDIIAYRDEHGVFGSIEELKNVSGIGESTFNKLKPYITIN